MKLRYVALLISATFLLASAGTAYGGPSLKKIVRDIAGLKQNDRTLLARIQATSLTTNVVSAPLAPESVRGFYRGSVSCPTDSRLTGGGVGWGNTTYYPQYRVTYSRPDDGGTSWMAAVYTGTDPAPTGATVYAVCGKAN